LHKKDPRLHKQMLLIAERGWKTRRSSPAGFAVNWSKSSGFRQSSDSHQGACCCGFIALPGNINAMLYVRDGSSVIPFGYAEVAA